MIRQLTFVACAALLAPTHLAASAGGPLRPSGSPGELTIGSRTIILEDARQVEVEAGELLVPEHRRPPQGAAISIPFYRLRSTAEHPATPIVLLAGGPGSSWLDRFEDPEYFQEVDRYRAIADVVVFDQRGAGRSRPDLDCEDRRQLPLEAPIDLEEVAANLREMAAQCRDRWHSAGVDLSAYTTAESVDDVLELAAALGYRRMSLVGGSYGSHLALALMRAAPDAVDRVVLYGVEGLDHTWDDPGARLAAYERIAGTAELSAALAPAIPPGGLIEALRTVVERLEEKPVAVWTGDGDERARVVVDATVIRRLAGFQAGRRSRPNVWPELLLDLLEGEYGLAARAARSMRDLRLDDPMHYMMDCASGISPRRAARYRSHPAQELLGDVNFEYETLCDVWQAPDLGPDFRAPLVSAIPTLIVHGTWDSSTPIENAREVIASLSNGHLIEVIGGSHGALYDLDRSWPPMRERLAAFLRGERVRFPTSVTLPPVELSRRGGG